MHVGLNSGIYRWGREEGASIPSQAAIRNSVEAVFLDKTMSRVASNLENLEKSGNFIVG